MSNTKSFTTEIDTIMKELRIKNPNKEIRYSVTKTYEEAREFIIRSLTNSYDVICVKKLLVFRVVIRRTGQIIRKLIDYNPRALYLYQKLKELDKNSITARKIVLDMELAKKTSRLMRNVHRTYDQEDFSDFLDYNSALEYVLQETKKNDRLVIFDESQRYIVFYFDMLQKI